MSQPIPGTCRGVARQPVGVPRLTRVHSGHMRALGKPRAARSAYFHSSGAGSFGAGAGACTIVLVVFDGAGMLARGSRGEGFGPELAEDLRASVVPPLRALGGILGGRDRKQAADLQLGRAQGLGRGRVELHR